MRIVDHVSISRRDDDLDVSGKACFMCPRVTGLDVPVDRSSDAWKSSEGFIECPFARKTQRETQNPICSSAIRIIVNYGHSPPDPRSEYCVLGLARANDMNSHSLLLRVVQRKGHAQSTCLIHVDNCSSCLNRERLSNVVSKLYSRCQILSDHASLYASRTVIQC